jgi:hypothetical protein
LRRTVAAWQIGGVSESSQMRDAMTTMARADIRRVTPPEFIVSYLRPAGSLLP